MKSEKYVSTIEFHDQIFCEEDVDQVKAETRVACVALDKLLDLEFNEGDEGSDESDVEDENDQEISNSCVSEKPSMDIDTIDTLIDNNQNQLCIETPSQEPITFFEPLTKRIQIVLDTTSEYTTSSYLRFKHSMTPVLTENEWKILKEIKDKIFRVNFDESDDMPGYMMSVLINSNQLFGSGATEKEARDATIIEAFEYIEEEHLKMDEIEISKLTVDDDDEDEDHENEDGIEDTDVCSDMSCIEKLRDFQITLQRQNKCLEEVPSFEILEKIGIDFEFEYAFEKGTVDSRIEQIKEMTARYAIRKLMDLVYDLDD